MVANIGIVATATPREGVPQNRSRTRATCPQNLSPAPRSGTPTRSSGANSALLCGSGTVAHPASPRAPPYQGGAPWCAATCPFAGTLRSDRRSQGASTCRGRCSTVLALTTKTRRFAGISLICKPSDGLEPSTPSLPWRFPGVTRVHARSSATRILLESGLFAAAGMRRETSRVSFLMCPFCVRAP
jgi:hypothetical protein